MAGSLIASLAQTFWDQRSRYYQNVLVDSLGTDRAPVRESINQMTEAGFSTEQSWSLVWHETVIQADMLALNDFFMWSSVAFALSIGVIWFARNSQPAKAKN